MDADRFVLLRWMLPVVAGAGIAAGLSRFTKAEPVVAPPTSPAESAGVSLPDDEEVICLAALSGRTKEARAKVAALVASGAEDEEITKWLAPLLLADPGWLDDFILTVPEARRIELARMAISKLGGLHPDAVWELLRQSPYARVAVCAPRTEEKLKVPPGLLLLASFVDSPLAAEVAFDPATGFSPEQLAELFKYGVREPANCRRILEEWFTGRWKGEPPGCVRRAWLSLRWNDESASRELAAKVPAELKSLADGFETLGRIQQVRGELGAEPPLKDLTILNGGELAQLVEQRAMSGKPLSLEALAKLPADKRSAAFDDYFAWLYPFNAAAAHDAIDGIDRLDLTDTERTALLKGAASGEWNSQGDFRRAYELASRMPAGKAREGLEQNLMDEFAHYDPQDALAWARSLPPGELRDKAEKLALDSLP